MPEINFDSYNLVYEKLSYYVRCKDKLFIYAILALLTILTFSITEENLYSPIIGSFVIIIFFAKWSSIKYNIAKLSSYLRVNYEQSPTEDLPITFQTDSLLYDIKYFRRRSFDNMTVFTFWFFISLIPIMVSIGLYLLMRTEGNAGINDLAKTFMEEEINWCFIAFLCILCFLVLLYLKYFETDLNVNWANVITRFHTVLIIPVSIIFLVFGLFNPFLQLVWTHIIESPSILIICSIEAVISMLVLVWSVYLGYSLSNTKKIDDNWKAVFETKGR